MAYPSIGFNASQEHSEHNDEHLKSDRNFWIDLHIPFCIQYPPCVTRRSSNR